MTLRSKGASTQRFDGDGMPGVRKGGGHSWLVAVKGPGSWERWERRTQAFTDVRGDRIAGIAHDDFGVQRVEVRRLLR